MTNEKKSEIEIKEQNKTNARAIIIIGIFIALFIALIAYEIVSKK